MNTPGETWIIRPSHRTRQVVRVAESRHILVQAQAQVPRGDRRGSQSLSHPPSAEPGRIGPDDMIERQQGGAALERGGHVVCCR